MKTLGFFTFFVAITSSGLAQTTPLPTPTAQPVTPYEEMVNAKPILINGLEFVASTQAQWQARASLKLRLHRLLEKMRWRFSF